MSEIDFTLTRGDEDIAIVVEYSIRGGSPAIVGGPPEACDPGEPPEITELTAYRGNDEFALTDEEISAVEAHIFETHDFDDYDYSDWEE